MNRRGCYMNRHLTLIVLLVTSVGLTYPLVSNAGTCHRVVKHWFDSNDKLHVESIEIPCPEYAFDGFDVPKQDKNKKVLPAGPYDPPESFRVENDLFGFTTYVPDEKGNLKIKP